MTLQHITQMFLQHCRYGKKLSEKTLAAYTIDLNDFLACLGSERALITCDRDAIRQFLTYLQDVKQLKASSIKRRVACVKAMFRWLEVEELADNPFHKMSIAIKTPHLLPKSLCAGSAET
ncbi:tyrosine-type recombinase/integrase [Magnetofaba australis]|uniref:Core-binding (CB) domain-containing protein n=1 Tax=Magnetofaba australis IT-1 TaxID=1434232 RepID=A0A1Y2JZE8_9PROT|nr:site-specific integrase [Magnetofaba australis]OSM00285.1 hypothetical protein MAIT1_05456 [Magnetofaba australis IT-1]